MRDGQRTVLLTDFFEDIPPEAFADIDATLLQQILPEIGAGRTAGIISALESDDALDLIIDQEPDFQQRIMHKLSARMRLTLEEGLNFPEDSAGRLMQREVVAVPHFWSVGKALDYLREASSSVSFRLNSLTFSSSTPPITFKGKSRLASLYNQNALIS